jgi:O-acetyl-ADP-ribose deacetylase (regulator of RNase III)
VIRVVVDDLASVSADAIVRPATIRLAPLTAAAERVDRAGGAAFQAAVELRDDLAVGAAVVTAGGGLAAEFVIHAVVASAPADVTAKGLRRAWLSVLERAREWQFAHLATPPLHPGSATLPLGEVAGAMAEVLREVAGSGDFPSSISFVVDSEEDRAVFKAALRVGEASPP